MNAVTQDLEQKLLQQLQPKSGAAKLLFLAAVEISGV
jgi:hypothetical protein